MNCVCVFSVSCVSVCYVFQIVLKQIFAHLTYVNIFIWKKNSNKVFSIYDSLRDNIIYFFRLQEKKMYDFHIHRLNEIWFIYLNGIMIPIIWIILLFYQVIAEIWTIFWNFEIWTLKWIKFGFELYLNDPDMGMEILFTLYL